MPENRRHTMRSFTWEPKNGDEISSCPDCTHWHALFEVEDDGGVGSFVTVREWHEAECPVWNENDG